MAGRSYPIPSRTRSSSSPAPMVLHGQPCGRVGRRRGLVPPRPSREALLAGVLLFSPVHFAQYPREIRRVRGFAFLPGSCSARRGQPPSRRSAAIACARIDHATGALFSPPLRGAFAQAPIGGFSRFRRDRRGSPSHPALTSRASPRSGSRASAARTTGLGDLEIQ